MDIKIRKATLKDLEEMQKLNLMLFEKEYNEYDKTLNKNWTFGKKGKNYFKERILDSKNAFAMVSVVNKEVVGYLVGNVFSGENYRKQMKFAEGENMFVLSKFRGKGIGTQLFEEFLRWCKQKGVDRVKLVASSENKRAIKLYRNLGFRDYSLTFEKDI